MWQCTVGLLSMYYYYYYYYYYSLFSLVEIFL
jgi:hypothetical protein